MVDLMVFFGAYKFATKFNFFLWKTRWDKRKADPPAARKDDNKKATAKAKATATATAKATATATATIKGIATAKAKATAGTKQTAEATRTG
jgi:hypothetical protein